MSKQSLTTLGLGSDLDQPDGRLDGFYLTEERADAAELVVPPVLEQTRRFWADLPLGGTWQGQLVKSGKSRSVDRTRK